jgi:hypothetical protein
VSTNVTVNLGRAQVMRAVAAWLEENPALPIKCLSVDDNGEVRLAPAEADGPTTTFRDPEIHGLYRLAEEVGAEVTFASDSFGSGWELTARWQVGVVPMRTDHRIYEAAVNVRPTEHQPGG